MDIGMNHGVICIVPHIFVMVNHLVTLRLEVK